MRNLLKNLENLNRLSIDDPAGPPAGGDPPKPDAPLIGSVKEGEPKPDAHVVPDKYEFAKIGEGDKAVDAPEAVIKAVTEFAKANKMSQAQAQAFLSHQLANQKEGVPAEYVFAKIKQGDKEVDVPKEVADPVAAFAKENGLTQTRSEDAGRSDGNV